jgi:uncharacterized protein DUF664
VGGGEESQWRRYGDPVDAQTRVEPPRGVGDERGLLDGWLDYYRATALHKCADLSAEQLVTRSCPPSPLSLIGLMRHLTEMERAYAHRLADPATPLLYCTEDNPEGDFEDIDITDVGADLDTFTEHCARSREIMAGLPLDGSLRWSYLYLIKEYARHLGHADLLRERIDGATGE